MINKAVAQGAAEAYRTYRKHQHALRLNNQEYARLPKEAVAPEAVAVLALWAAVLGARTN